FEGRRIDLVPVIDLKLLSVARVSLPESGDFDFFAFGNRKNHTYGCRSGSTVKLHSQNRVVRVMVLIGNSTDRSLQGGRLVIAFFYFRVLHSGILLQRYKNGKPQRGS